MPVKLFLLLNILLSIGAFGCTAAVENSNEVVLTDDDQTVARNADEVVFEDNQDSFQNSAFLSASPTPPPMTVTKGNDNSEITTMIDKYGNKTEMRAFPGHERLTSVFVRTSPEGVSEALVYGQSGKVRALPANISERAMTATADELANSAGIYNTVSPPLAPRNTLQPEPSYKFPVQNQSVQKFEETKKSAESGGQNDSENSEQSQSPSQENFPPANEKL